MNQNFSMKNIEGIENYYELTPKPKEEGGPLYIFAE